MKSVLPLASMTLASLLVTSPCMATEGEARVTSPTLAAASPEDVDPKTETPGSVWYGWQILVADGASALAIGGGLALRSPALVSIGTVTALGVAPVIHVAQRHPSGAVGSLALRLALPASGAVIGFLASLGDAKGHGWSTIETLERHAGTGAGIGLVLASILDVAIFAEREERTPSSAVATHLRIRPSVAVGPQAAHVGLGGAF